MIKFISYFLTLVLYSLLVVATVVALVFVLDWIKEKLKDAKSKITKVILNVIRVCSVIIFIGLLYFESTAVFKFNKFTFLGKERYNDLYEYPLPGFKEYDISVVNKTNDEELLDYKEYECTEYIFELFNKKIKVVTCKNDNQDIVEREKLSTFEDYSTGNGGEDGNNLFYGGKVNYLIYLIGNWNTSHSDDTVEINVNSKYFNSKAIPSGAITDGKNLDYCTDLGYCYRVEPLYNNGKLVAFNINEEYNYEPESYYEDMVDSVYGVRIPDSFTLQEKDENYRKYVYKDGKSAVYLTRGHKEDSYSIQDILGLFEKYIDKNTNDTQGVMFNKHVTTMDWVTYEDSAVDNGQEYTVTFNYCLTNNNCVVSTMTFMMSNDLSDEQKNEFKETMKYMIERSIFKY